MARRRITGSDLGRELGAAELGDSRRSRRLEQIVDRVAARPDASFPEAVRSEGELEALYRFLSNEHVAPAAILEPHITASCARANDSSDVLVVHDTTYFVFEGEREGLGRVQLNNRGFWAHFALAVGLDREAFGVVGLEHGTRTGPSRWKGSRRIKSVGADEPSEALRWPNLVTKVAARFGRSRVVHVMDREADWFELFEHMRELGERFVVRLTHDRALDDGSRLDDLLERATALATRDVELSARAEGDTARQRARHPARQPRSARLQIRAASATLRGSKSKTALPLHVVSVVEIDPPEGNAPVRWKLVTTEPVATADDVLRVVDAYRARWVIEEFFKALKTGCAFERRQLGSYAALTNALAVLAPVAWSLLRLRDTGRRHPETNASRALEPQLMAILMQIARRPLPPSPTARDVMYAVAGLGGHLPRNGDPGWQTLGRGFERLLEAQRLLSLLT